MSKTKLPVIHFDRLTARQKQAFYRECEKIGPADGRPLTAADRKLHQQARKRGRPVIGQGAQRVQISMERGLLMQADAFAKIHHLSRAQLLARAIAQFLAGAA